MKRAKFYFNCSTPSHLSYECKATPCTRFRLSHNILLHFDKNKNQGTKQVGINSNNRENLLVYEAGEVENNQMSESPTTRHIALINRGMFVVFKSSVLSTVKVHVRVAQETFVSCIVLLDLWSINENLVNTY